MSYDCPRCRQSFVIGEPDKAEYTRCAAPGCRLLFWHGVKGSPAGGVRVGVHPTCVPSGVKGKAHQAETGLWVLPRQYHEAVRDAVEKSSVVHAREHAGGGAGVRLETGENRSNG